MLTVGELFAGIGGFGYGLERAGMRVVWQCEVDEFCQRVLAEHWPNVPRYGDIRKLSALDWYGLDGVDVLCGGFPCQDISLAGNGAGIDGARSGLWGEYARLIGELRPGYVIVENVAALLTRGLGRVLGDLAALGYDAEWDCLPASAFGAPHRRDRVWLVAYPDGSGRQPGILDVQAWQSHVEGRGPDVADTEREPGHVRRSSQERGRAQDAEQAGLGGRGGGTTVADSDCASGASEGTAGEPLYGSEALERSGRCGGVRGDVQDADECAVQSWRVGGRAAQAGGSEWWTVEPPVGRVAHGVPDRLDRLAALGNALVPQIAEWIGRRIVEHEEGRRAA